MTDHFFPREDYFMRLALREAALALEHDDVPIGAVIVRDGEVIATGHNERELRQDPTAHAEVLALREAALHDGSWRVLDAVLYVTLEPCAMCAGALVLARLPRVVYGARDPKAGACGSVLDVLGEPRLNHRPDVAGGLLGEECGASAERVLRRAPLEACGAARPRCAGRSFAPATGSSSLVGHPPGGVAERLNAAVSKTVVRLIGVPGVRISPPPL